MLIKIYLNVIQSRPGAHLCNLLFVINHQQRYRQQDDSKALNSFLKSSSSGQLVALLQAGDEVREAQAHSRQALLRAAVLKNKEKQKSRSRYRQRLITNFILNKINANISKH